MKKELFVLSLLITFIILSGCVEEKKETTNETYIKIEYSIGSGWTGWNDTIVFENDGNISEVERLPLGRGTVKKIGKISRAELEELASFALSERILDMEDSYVCVLVCPTDMPTSSLKLVVGDRAKIIKIETSEIPISLKKTMEKIKSYSKILKTISDEESCESDEDCAPTYCCHATACTNKNYAPSCYGIVCTLECRPNTIDCGGGCRCENGKCIAYHAIVD